jgi:ubiquinone/menaquinone biosynthesis C-methylase UbiE
MAERLSRTLPEGIEIPATLTGNDFSVLVAGCGTGKQVIELARWIPNCRVLAVDLSRQSLAYAQQKALEYGVKNVRFAQADILRLEELLPRQRFDIVMSTGVLHHMQEPLKAWRILRNLLNAQGIMHIALYSRLARAHINKVRAVIAASNLPPSPTTIQAVRALSLRGELPSLADSPDFYSTSTCRDLFFHVHEQQFDVPEIAAALKQLDLRFLGFDNSPDTLPNFVAEFPTPQAQLDLERWHPYELAHPNVFARMYSLWCVPANRD